jgi:hypothetical protein
MASSVTDLGIAGLFKFVEQILQFGQFAQAMLSQVFANPRVLQ